MSEDSFGSRLREFRQRAGFSQEHLAHQAGLSVEAVGALERGLRRAPYPKTLGRLIQALELDDRDEALLRSIAERARARHMETTLSASQQTLPFPSGAPLPLTSLIGRNADVDALRILLEQNRIITVTGAGGIGKTRAALELVQSLTAADATRVLFVDLSLLAESRLIISALAAKLDLEHESAESVSIAIGDERLILFLDNCEHLVVDVAAFSSSLLRQCPNLRILATSRERLAIYGEMVYRLPPLTCPDIAPERLAEARQYSAVELFVQRASSSDALRSLDDGSTIDIVEICRLFDGVPLAIELSAARVSSFGLSALRSRLESGLLFETALRDLPFRQQTTLATIEWSFRLLSPTEQTTLERASVFVGGFSLDAAESVCANDNLSQERLDDVLSSLVDKSLLELRQTAGTARYSMLETVRNYASKRLNDRSAASRIERRHAEWVGSFADRIELIIATSVQKHVYAMVEPEFGNVRKALTFLDRSASSGDRLLQSRIVGGLRFLWFHGGARAELNGLATRLIEDIDEAEHPEVAARLLRCLIQTAGQDDILRWSSRATAIFERIDDVVGLAMLSSTLARYYCCRKRVYETEREIARAEKLFTRIPKARVFYALGLLQERAYLRILQERFIDASADVDEAVHVMQSLGMGEPLALRRCRGNIQIAMGDATAGTLTMQQIIDERFRTVVDGHDLQVIYAAALDQARARLALDDQAGALLSCIAALSLLKRGMVPPQLGHALELCAVAVCAGGNTRGAAKLSLFARSWGARSGFKTGFCTCLVLDEQRKSLNRRIEECLSLSELRMIATDEATLTDAMAIALARKELLRTRDALIVPHPL